MLFVFLSGVGGRDKRINVAANLRQQGTDLLKILAPPGFLRTATNVIGQQYSDGR